MENISYIVCEKYDIWALGTNTFRVEYFFEIKIDSFFIFLNTLIEFIYDSLSNVTLVVN